MVGAVAMTALVKTLRTQLISQGEYWAGVLTRLRPLSWG
jgi:hypothetical protein